MFILTFYAFRSHFNANSHSCFGCFSMKTSSRVITRALLKSAKRCQNCIDYSAVRAGAGYIPLSVVFVVVVAVVSAAAAPAVWLFVRLFSFFISFTD